MIETHRPYRVIISGGGTGGHLYPAIAIADALKSVDSSIEILFVGALGRIEMERVPQAGYAIEGLDITGINRTKILQNLLFPIKLAKALWRSRQILKEFRPDIAIGVGGFASGPLLYMAGLQNIPTIIQEQNSYPGLTNRILGKNALKIFGAYEELYNYFPKSKVEITGNPVRKDLATVVNNATASKQQAAQYFGLSKDKKTVYVTGGSLGALTLNDSLLNGLSLLKQEDIQVVWQCGKYYYNNLKDKINTAEFPTIRLVPFVERTELAYALADIVVSRAGASTISELCLTRKPSILVPSPNVAADHQTKNAMALVNKKAAYLVKDSEARAMLVPSVLSLLKSDEKQQILSENIGKMTIINADLTIAAEIIKLISQRIG